MLTTSRTYFSAEISPLRTPLPSQSGGIGRGPLAFLMSGQTPLWDCWEFWGEAGARRGIWLRAQVPHWPVLFLSGLDLTVPPRQSQTLRLSTKTNILAPHLAAVLVMAGSWDWGRVGRDEWDRTDRLDAEDQVEGVGRAG
jgi:hypothetical protein